jgi:hypothetical protein
MRLHTGSYPARYEAGPLEFVPRAMLLAERVVAARPCGLRATRRDWLRFAG